MAETEGRGEITVLELDVVADRPLVSQTRFGEDDSVAVEWMGVAVGRG